MCSHIPIMVDHFDQEVVKEGQCNCDDAVSSNGIHDFGSASETANSENGTDCDRP